MSRALLFNPVRAREGELEATLVARAPLLDELEAAIVGDVGSTTRHWLIVAPRGSGKSHLTEALARRVRARPDWSVVRLPEEAYRVSSAADLLAWVVGALEKVDRPFANETDPFRIETLAESRLRRWRAEHGPVLVILENLNELLGRRFDRRGQARLRAILMGDPPFTLVATSTRMFAEVTDHGAPFYDFFQERRLEELTADEAGELIARRARWDNATELLDNPDEVRPRLRALYHLSGGNPRLALALYTVLRAGLTHQLYDQLMQLLDDVTPYYQARLHDASPQGARVLAEMAMASGPQVPSELGRRCGLRTSQVTAVLAQLQEERFVRPGGRPVDKRARYWEVTDRLFRVWLQMREQGDPQGTIRWIVEFYQGWYGGNVEGAGRDAARLVQDAWKEGGRAWDDLNRTLRHMEEAFGADGRVSLLAWAGGKKSMDVSREFELQSLWEGGDVGASVPLAQCHLERGNLQSAEDVLRPAVASGDLHAMYLTVILRQLSGQLDEGWELAVGWGERGYQARHYVLMALVNADRDEDAWSKALDCGMEMECVVALIQAGRPDVAVRARGRFGDRFVDEVGPDWLFARFVSGEQLGADDLVALRGWLRPRAGTPAVSLALTRSMYAQTRSGTSDAALILAESAFPDDAVQHIGFRLLRRRRAIEQGEPFNPLAPFPLDPGAVLQEWSKIRTDPRGLRGVEPFLPQILPTYTALRAMNLLPELPPYADAERVLAAADREAELSALHPEVREAVLLLLGERLTPLA